MVGLIKNLFGGKDNYYAELKEENTVASETKTQTTKEEQPAAQEKAQPEPTPAPSPQPPMMAQNNGQPQAEELRGETFAPAYLTPKPTPSRRRPGVNMREFLDLARDMNTPRNQ